MRGPLDILKYLLGSIRGNLLNMWRAGSNKVTWGIIGGAIVGFFLGSGYPVIGNILGAVVGGVLGSTVAYGLS